MAVASLAHASVTFICRDDIIGPGRWQHGKSSSQMRLAYQKKTQVFQI
jgi:hypothetical protein